MATQTSTIRPIEVLAGVQPSTDKTNFSTPHYTLSDKIRFIHGVATKVGGWRSFPFSTGNLIEGVSRSMWGGVLSNSIKTLIGTNEKLYFLLGQELFNITPLQTSSVALGANPISNLYGTLASNPIATVDGSNTITVSDANAGKLRVGDTIELSGSSAVGGIPDTDINTAHKIRSVSSGQYTVYVATSATSTTSGGGASVVRATGLVEFSATAHGQLEGDRVKIAGSTDVGGILAAEINKEFIIREVGTNYFDVMTDGVATSSVGGGGGASIVYYKEIEDGVVDYSFGQGYGMGKYGVGRYGVSKTSTAGIIYPRIWFIDRFADVAVMTPGNQGKLYSWSGTSDVAPTVISGSPSEVNYSFVSDSIAVTFGDDNVQNRIYASDQNDISQWTDLSENQVFIDDIEGAGRLISHCPANGENLIFTNTQTYRFSYIGPPLVWSISLLDNSVGIIGPMARCSVNNTAYWMSNNNFYRWRGGNAEIIPANSQDQSTILNYVFDNINQDQAYKCFAWYNAIADEVWFHYPSADSTECDRVARVHISDNVWSPDTFDRTCAEYPENVVYNPRLVAEDGTLYIHEIGVDDDTLPMAWSLTSNTRFGGKHSNLLSGYLPDSSVNGDISFRIQGYLFPQSPTASYDKTFVVTEDTTAPPPAQIGARFWKYTWSGEELGQNFIMGNWLEYIQQGSDT